VKAVLFAPHNDDETLFAFYSMLRHQAEVVVVLRSMRQERQQNGPTYQVREAETLCATSVAGVSYVQWIGFYDTHPDWAGVYDFVLAYFEDSEPEVVICPVWEEGGHEDHNQLAAIVAGIASTQRRPVELIRYLTYRRGHGRSEGGVEVIPTPDEKEAKLAALRCYQSQMDHPPTAPWFGVDQREFVLC
jgi:LmbE family N-acetylglucosaminyl deacetylase